MADDPVDLTDLEVIQRWSLAVRSASAARAEVVDALRADLAWLEGRTPRTRPRFVESDDSDTALEDDAGNGAVDQAGGDGGRTAPKRARTAATARRGSAPVKRGSKKVTSKQPAQRTTKQASGRRSTTRGGTRRR